MIKFVFTYLVLASTNFTFGQVDSIYYRLYSDVLIYNDSSIPGFDRERYYSRKTNEPFNGWIINQYKNKSVWVFDVRNGYQNGFYLYYVKTKSSFALRLYQYYSDGMLTTSVALNSKKSEEPKIYWSEHYNILYSINQDSLEYTRIEYSQKDSIIYKSEIYVYPKNHSKPKKGIQVDVMKYPSHDMNDSICFTFCEGLLNNFPLTFKTISEFPAPPKFYIQNSSCGKQRIPVFNYKYAYPLSK